MSLLWFYLCSPIFRMRSRTGGPATSGRTLSRYAVAVLSAAVGLLLAVLLTRILGTSPVAVLLSAVALAAWSGGRRPALLTALLVLGPSLVVAPSPSSGQLLPPAFSRAATLEPIQLGLAAASAVLIAAASGHLRATRAAEFQPRRCHTSSSRT